MSAVDHRDAYTTKLLAPGCLNYKWDIYPKMGPSITWNVKNDIYNVHSFFVKRKGDKESV